MVTALDVGAYIYKRQGWVDAWSLEKLTYFVQAWHLAWSGKPIFSEKFQAWPDGPVEPRLHRVNKYDRPRRDALGPRSTKLPGGDPDALDPFAQAAANAVLDYYGSLSKTKLIELTHDDYPWQHARDGLGESEPSSNELSIASMRRCYGTKIREGAVEIPQPPSKAPEAITAGPAYRDEMHRQIDGWRDTLALLAER